MLVHWDGFSIADAARLLSINNSTARTRYGRALRRLERTLQHRDQDTGAVTDGLHIRRSGARPGLNAGTFQ